MVTIRGYPDLDVSDRWDRIFQQLSHSARRQLVLALAGQAHETWIELPDELQSTPADLSDDELAISLYHHHLPMLANDGYIKWKTSPLAAARGPRFSELESLLETIIDQAGSLPNHLVYGCDILENAQG